VTDGAAPIRWFIARMPRVTRRLPRHVPSIPRGGDAFVGGLLYPMAERAHRCPQCRFVATRGIDDALRFAAAVGGTAVTRHGAFAAMPSATGAQ
jgi:fructokinase